MFNPTRMEVDSLYKKLISLLVTVVLSISFMSCIPVTAAVIIPDASPAYLYTSECSSTLTISGKTATCTSYASGYRNETTKIVITQTLQKKTSTGSWSKVSSWSETDTGYKGSATNTKSGLSKGTYRLKTVFKVYAGSKYETITKYSSNKTI